MTVIYLHHSGFAVLLDNLTLVFDPISELPREVLNNSKNIIFFISHGHGDHYDRNIWRYDSQGVYYIVSDDISKMHNGKNIEYVHPYQSIKIGDINIATFGSTDQGISVLVEVDGKTIFFAGDLNWWAWNPASRPHIVPEVEERDYKEQIANLKKYLNGKTIDLAFVPVDPRLDTPGGELLAAQYFIQELHPKELVPMHFWGDFDVINRLIKSLPKDNTTVIGKMTDRNQVVDFK